ncbi:HPP family protein [Erwinia sp.]|uniref:HPP family protein n=1 Tax=Erwinia citreus TaxID=558 RepID=UPI003C707D28
MNLLKTLTRWARTFWPQAALPARKERFAAAIGAAIALTGTNYLSHLMLGEANPWFIAPMGASAVLLFGVPASPLAQPWSIIGGNLIASFIGVACAQWIGHTDLAGGIAVGLTISLMFSLRCLHPPSGAVALTAVFGGPAISHLGFGFVLYPVLINSLFLTAVALVFNNALRRRYPHAAPVKTTTDTTQVMPAQRVGVSREDLHAVLAERGDYLDIYEDDLQEILSQAQQRAHRRQSGDLH